MRPELLATFDTALVGCMVIVSCIEDEIKSMKIEEPGQGSLSVKQKVKAVWNEENIKELVGQLRGQQTALGLLMQTIQM
jgi:hypothetical protein